MNDWPTTNQILIADFVSELKEYFGTPLTIEKIKSREADLTKELDSWRIESGSSLAEMIAISTQACNENDFDKILQKILNFYDESI